MAPTFPVVDFRANHFHQRLEQTRADELRHPEAIEGHDVVAAADAQVEGVLLLELLVAAAELDQLDINRRALRRHRLLEGGDDEGGQPHGKVVVHAAHHTAASDRDFDRFLGLGGAGAERHAHQRQDQAGHQRKGGKELGT